MTFVREIVEVSSGGPGLSGWKSVSINYSATSPERAFTVTAAEDTPDLFGAAWDLEPESPVSVTANGILVVHGHVEDLEIELDGESHLVTVTGKSKGRDACQCSVVHDSYEWTDKNLGQIASDIDSWGVGFNYKGSPVKLTKVRANLGESGFQFLDRLARNEGKFLTGKPDGSVDITKHGDKRHAGGLIEGVNLKSGKAKFSGKDRFGKIKTKGQTPWGTGGEAHDVEGEADDSGSRSSRVKILMPRTALNKSQAKDRAEQAKNVRQGKGRTATIDLPSWRDQGGVIWEAGWLVFVDSPTLKLSQDMAISKVHLTQDENTTNASLELVDPRALGGKKSGGKVRSASVWDKS